MNSKKTIKIWTMVLVKECAGKTTTEQKKIILRLKEILQNKKRGYLLQRIVCDALDEMKKLARFEIILAHPQTANEISYLENKLSKHFGNDNVADIKIDPAIIGGFVAKNNQYLIDASVKGNLEKLRKIYQQN